MSKLTNFKSVELKDAKKVEGSWGWGSRRRRRGYSSRRRNYGGCNNHGWW